MTRGWAGGEVCPRGRKRERERKEKRQGGKEGKITETTLALV